MSPPDVATRHPKGTSSGGQFAPDTHAEGVLAEPLEAIDGPQTGDAALDAALADYNVAASAEGVRIGPPSPLYREHEAARAAARDRCTGAFADSIGPDVDQVFADARTEATADVVHELETHRLRLTEARDRALKEKRAGAAIEIIRQAAGESYSRRAPTRAQMEAHLGASIGQVEDRIRQAQVRVGTDQIIGRLPESLRARSRLMPSDALKRWTEPSW